MNTMVNLLKDYQIGTWCKRAAWIIIAIGIINVILDVYTLLAQYNNAVPQPLQPYVFWTAVRFALTNVPITLFYFFILYAAGALVNYFVVDAEETGGEEDEEVLDEDDEEEVTPGQMR